MRLHLDTASALTGANQTSAANAAQGAAGGNKLGRDAGGVARDSVGLSGPSAALSRSAADRTVRIQQLTASVRAGSYNVSSAAIGGALVRQSVA